MVFELEPWQLSHNALEKGTRYQCEVVRDMVGDVCQSHLTVGHHVTSDILFKWAPDRSQHGHRNRTSAPLPLRQSGHVNWCECNARSSFDKVMNQNQWQGRHSAEQNRQKRSRDKACAIKIPSLYKRNATNKTGAELQGRSSHEIDRYEPHGFMRFVFATFVTLPRTLQRVFSMPPRKRNATAALSEKPAQQDLHAFLAPRKSGRIAQAEVKRAEEEYVLPCF